MKRRSIAIGKLPCARRINAWIAGRRVDAPLSARAAGGLVGSTLATSFRATLAAGLASASLAAPRPAIDLRGFFAGVLVHEILHPALQHAGGELAANGILQGGLGHLDLVGQAEDLQDLLVALETDGTQQRGHRQLLLPVDVGVHHPVDVRGEFDP